MQPIVPVPRPSTRLGNRELLFIAVLVLVTIEILRFAVRIYKRSLENAAGTVDV